MTMPSPCRKCINQLCLRKKHMPKKLRISVRASHVYKTSCTGLPISCRPTSACSFPAHHALLKWLPVIFETNELLQGIPSSPAQAKRRGVRSDGRLRRQDWSIASAYGCCQCVQAAGVMSASWQGRKSRSLFVDSSGDNTAKYNRRRKVISR